MSVFCLLCEQPMSGEISKTVNVTKGINSLREASVIRGYGLHEKLIDSQKIIVHVECRRKYTLIHLN